MLTRILTIIFLTLLISSCQNHEKKENSSCNGIWKSIGHSQILAIKDSITIAVYDVTKISCLPIRIHTFKELESSFSLKNDTLTLHEGPFIYRFLKATNLPDLCQNSLSPEKAKDPLYNFEVFMETVKENYAFLELNKINWEKLYRNQKGKLTTNSSDGELYLVIEETFEMLNDNHAFLNATEDVYDDIDKLEKENKNKPENELEELGDFPVADLVSEHHIQEVLTKDSWLINWGKMTDEIGYIQLKAMWLFAELDISQALIDSVGYVDAYGIIRSKMFKGDYMKKEVEGVNKLMGKVMKDLAGTKSIVVDVRFNGGGQDVVSLEILSHFNSNRIQFASQKIRYGDKYTPTHPIFLKSKQSPYTKPVYVLTSPQSGSAAETFALATMEMPNVKRIGSSTEGAMSTTLDKKLPNGWDFCVSNEVIRDNEGNFYENIGIPVDYELNYSRDRQFFFRSIVNNLDADKKSILLAIKELEIKVD